MILYRSDPEDAQQSRVINLLALGRNYVSPPCLGPRSTLIDQKPNQKERIELS